MIRKPFLYFLIMLIFTSCGIAGAVVAAEVRPASPAASDDFVLAKKAFEDEFYDISQEQLERFLLNYPQNERRDEAHLLLGRCYIALGKYAQAVNEFDIVLSSSSANRLYEEAVYWSAEAYFNGRDYKQALNRYGEVISSYPGSERAKQSAYSRGWCYFNMKEYDSAIGAFEEFIKKYPNDNLAADAKYKIADSLFMSDKPAEAKSMLSKFLKEYTVSKKMPDAYFLMGEIDYQNKEYKEASADYTRALEMNPKAVWAAFARYGRAWSDHRAGEYKSRSRASCHSGRIIPTAISLIR
ncbi:MAG TPA: tetratricopeptide repeat protein [Candidatus Omnitrophota bacterium]|nr:tetratricopeptide repeat protein [Candidatus Omnitrophota bacterium]